MDFMWWPLGFGGFAFTAGGVLICLCGLGDFGFEFCSGWYSRF